MNIGTPDYLASKEQEQVRKTYFPNIKNGNQVYRILPPLFSLAKRKKWYEYYAVVWGFFRKETDFQTKKEVLKHFPFNDPVVFDNGRIVSRSKIGDFVKKLMEDRKKVTDAFKAGKISEEKMQQLLAKIPDVRIEKKFFLNAVDAEGNIGLLKLNSTLFHQLKDAILRYVRETGKDPLGKEGLYFNFYRNKSEDGQWVFSVTPATTKVKALVDGTEMLVDKPMVHKMDDLFLSRLEKEAFDLTLLYTTPSIEEANELVENFKAHHEFAAKLYQSHLDKLRELNGSSPKKEEKLEKSEKSVSLESSSSEELSSSEPSNDSGSSVSEEEVSLDEFSASLEKSVSALSQKAEVSFSEESSSEDSSSDLDSFLSELESELGGVSVKQ